MDDFRDQSAGREPIRIVDRRMFTPDGAPRTPDAGGGDESAAPQPNADHPPQVAGGHTVEPPSPATAGERGEEQAGEDRVASSHFRNLILNLATSAAAGLGEIPNPYSQRTELDLEGARQVIDLLRSLQIKTKGNLTSEESTLLDNLIYDLQMKYVSLQAQPPGKS